MKPTLTPEELEEERYQFQVAFDYILTDAEWTHLCGFLTAWAQRHEWDEHQAHMAFGFAMQEFIYQTLGRRGTMFPHLDSDGSKLPLPDYWRDLHRRPSPSSPGA